ncbi:MAG: heme-binding protein [Bacteroidota bacterium]|nr:heme-binding protein [Bacteroidota bacterium]
MKILKKILLILFILLGLFLLVSLFLPSKIRVERATLINAPASVVFDQINVLKNWKNWSYWDNVDSAMSSTYEGPESGVGAKHLWDSKNPDIAKGSLTITVSDPNKLVVTELAMDGMGSSLGGWIIDDTTNGVNVTSYMDMDMGFFGRIFPGLMMDGWLGPDFENSLAGLKQQSEKVASEPVPGTGLKIEVSTYNTQIIATCRMISSQMKISEDLGGGFGKIVEYIGKNKLEMTGSVFAIYHSYSPEKIDMECGIPVNKTAKDEGEVKTTEMKGGNAVVAHYYGDYAGTYDAHMAIDKWLKDNKKSATGAPWEVYITDPMVEKDTAKWLTDIYYPIE